MVPLPTGCIKDNNDISWEIFNFLLEEVSFEDTIGHLYIVDIEFDTKNATEREFAYNEIYPLIIEKKNLLIHVKGLYFNLYNNLLEAKMLGKLTFRQPRLMQIFFKNKFLPI